MRQKEQLNSIWHQFRFFFYYSFVHSFIDLHIRDAYILFVTANGFLHGERVP